MFSKYAYKTARAEYFIRVSIRYKHVRDTVKWCNRLQQAWGLYVHGQTEPHFPVPAIRHEVVYPWEDAGYTGMIYVNDNGVEHDPLLVACWDFYEVGPWYGKYQACYGDAKADWYRKHGAWNVQGVFNEAHSYLY